MASFYNSHQRKTEPSNSIEDLKRLQQDIELATDHMDRKVNKDEDAYIFLGSTRSGKSTLINYLIGNKLIGVRDPPFTPVCIKQADSSTGPGIGIGPTSETVFPSRWYSQRLGLALWDAPGFDDNRGVVQDITNAYYVFELFKNLKCAKIILVTDINDIARHNIRPFLTLLASVEKLLKDKMGVCFAGITIIFSKVPEKISGVEMNKPNITKLLEYQFLSSTNIEISQAAKNLVRHFIQNDKKIGFFKEATCGDITDAAINEGIFAAIESATSINGNILKQVSPSIAETSKLFLYEVREQLCSTDIFEELQNSLSQMFKDNVQDFGEFVNNVALPRKLEQQSQKLALFKDKLSQAAHPSISFDEKINRIRAIDPSIARFVDNHNLLHAAKFMEFSDRLLNLKESKHFDIRVQDLLIGAISSINELIINMKLKMMQISKEDADAQKLQADKKYEDDRKALRSQIDEVTKYNTDIMEKFNKHFELMHDAQAEKDQMIKQYFDGLRQEQANIREEQRKERRRIEKKEREREQERRQQEREAEERRDRERKRDTDERKELEQRMRQMAEDKGNKHEFELKFDYSKLLDKVTCSLPSILGLPQPKK